MTAKVVFKYCDRLRRTGRRWFWSGRRVGIRPRHSARVGQTGARL